jgi:intracellular sulfur oxidation DsrE/DsrF family protein
MDALTGKHRLAFDIDHHRDGRPLEHARGYLDTCRADYEAALSDVNVVLGLHGRGLGIALGDALWATYRLGEFYGVVDAGTKAAALRNVFTQANVTAGGPVTAATAVDVLQHQGVVVAACRVAIRTAAHRLAEAGRGLEGAIREALIAGVLPGVIVVPAMYVTLSRLQERGVAYAYVG